MVHIDISDPEKIYEIAAELMDEHKVGFSVMIDGDAAAERSGGQRKYTEGYSYGWTKMCADLRKSGNGGIINEIEYLENNMMVKVLEREMWNCYNDGDVDGMKTAMNGINGVMMVMKGSFSKIDVDRKNSELALKVRDTLSDKLAKYDTDKLGEMLKMIDEKESGDGGSDAS